MAKRKAESEVTGEAREELLEITLDLKKVHDRLRRMRNRLRRWISRQDTSGETMARSAGPVGELYFLSVSGLARAESLMCEILAAAQALGRSVPERPGCST